MVALRGGFLIFDGNHSSFSVVIGLTAEVLLLVFFDCNAV